jgi:hypothetical protein
MELPILNLENKALKRALKLGTADLQPNAPILGT